MARAIAPTFRAATERRCRGPRPSGFTLIEVVIVITIIAIAAALAIPSLGAGARQRELRRCLQGFVGAVKRASTVAVFHRRPVELRVMVRDRRYAVMMRDTDSRLEAPDGRDKSEDTRRPSRLMRRSSSGDTSGRAVLHEVELPEIASFGEILGGRDLGEEGIVFDFYPTGSSSGGTIELLFESGRGRPLSYKLAINPLVSSISIEDEK